MNLNAVQNCYFIGIGGIGMSAIARYLVSNGKNVAGYDRTPTQITKSLEKLGVSIVFEDEEKNIPASFLSHKDTLVIYTAAIPEGNLIFQYFKNKGFILIKRAVALGKITENTFCFAVAGTHGKTTTSAILGHIMQPLGATSFLGGIAENYQSNLILGQDKITVAEADEFDRSFLQLSPDIACITAMDADHLDIYKNSEALQSAFLDFSKKVTDTLVVAKGLPLRGKTYAVDQPADYTAFNLRIEDATSVFDVKTPNDTLKNIRFNLPGKHNLMNALAALAMADTYGVPLEKIKIALGSFTGISRRFTYKIKTPDFVLIDDYAHHPTEIQAVADTLRNLYPDEEILAVFQPHLFSRTRDFADDFASALEKFDKLLLLDIYPARELPIKGISSKWLLEKISLKNKKLVAKKDVFSEIKKSQVKIVVTLGAGDIGVLADSLKSQLE